MSRNARAAIAAAAAGGFVWFLGTAIAVQLLNRHGWASTPISSYLAGPQGAWLQGAYYVLAVALVLLGCCLPASSRTRRLRAGSVALVVAGCAVVLVAYTYGPWPLPGDPAHRTRVTVHVICSFLAFLSATVAMALATPLLWRGRRRDPAMAYAASVFLVEVAAGFAPEYAVAVYGALEKFSIAGLVAWLLAAALKYVRAT